MAAVNGGAGNGARNGARFTQREREVLRMLCEGKRPREIASTMVIAEDTARKHIKAICRKLGAHGAVEVIVIAPKLRLLDGD